MVNPVRIGLIGTHSTGKSLLARRIEMELRALGLTVTRTSGLGKRAKQAGFPKMHLHTAQSTEWVITTGAADELTAGLQASLGSALTPMRLTSPGAWGHPSELPSPPQARSAPGGGGGVLSARAEVSR